MGLQHPIMQSDSAVLGHLGKLRGNAPEIYSPVYHSLLILTSIVNQSEEIAVSLSRINLKIFPSYSKKLGTVWGLPTVSGGLGVRYSEDPSAAARLKYGSILPNQMITLPPGERVATCFEFSVLLISLLRAAGLTAEFNMVENESHANVVVTIRNDYTGRDQYYLLDAARHSFAEIPERPGTIVDDATVYMKSCTNRIFWRVQQDAIGLGHAEWCQELNDCVAGAALAGQNQSQRTFNALGLAKLKIGNKQGTIPFTEREINAAAFAVERAAQPELDKYFTSQGLGPNPSPSQIAAAFNLLLDSADSSSSGLKLDRSNPKNGVTPNNRLIIKIKLAELFPQTLTSGRSFLNNLENAVACFKVAITLDPQYRTARYNLAKALLDLRQYGDAEVVIHQALNVFQNDRYLLCLAGEAAGHLGDINNMERYYKKALLLDHNYVIETIAERNPDESRRGYFIWQVLGLAWSKGKDYESAATCFQHALAINPHDSTSAFELSYVRLKMGHLLGALASFFQGMRSLLNPNSRLIAIDPLENVDAADQ